MWQELIRIPLPGSLPDFVLPAFGVMMVVGFLVALQVAKMLARRSGLVLGAFGLPYRSDKDVRASLLFRLDSADADRLAEVLRTIHLADAVNRPAGTLSHGQKQWLEIGMLLMQDPKLLLLDEPVAGMTDEETARTGELFLSLKGKHSLMVVEHDMGFIQTISEKVTVLHEGSVLAEGTLEQVQADERVIEVYLGR